MTESLLWDLLYERFAPLPAPEQPAPIRSTEAQQARRRAALERDWREPRGRKA